MSFIDVTTQAARALELVFTEHGDIYQADEEQSLYEWAYSHNITTLPTQQRANPDGVVIRGHLAKMLVNYMMNVE